MVDADASGVAQHRAQQVAPRPVAGFRQLLRVPRRLRPVLALLRVLVRRRAHGRVRHQHLVQRRRVRAARVDAHRQVRHDAQPHPGRHRALLRHAALLVGDELQPHVELHQLLRVAPRVLRRAVVLRLASLRRAPLGELAQPLALVQAEQLEVPRARLVRRREVKQRAKRRELRRENPVALQRLRGVVHRLEFRSKLFDVPPVPLVQQRVLRHLLHRDVDRVDKPAGGGQIRRVLDRRDGFGGVHRVDQQVVRALGRYRLGNRAQVVEVADAPGLQRAHRVQLRHHTPHRVLHNLGGGGQGSRHHDQRAGLVQVVGFQVQFVVAGGQVAGHVERGFAPHHTVGGGKRRGPVLVLVGVARGAVFQPDPAVRVVPVVDVHVEVLLRALGGDHARRHGPGRPEFAAGVEVELEFFVRRVVVKRKPQGPQQLDKRLGGRLGEQPVRGAVGRAEAIRLGEGVQQLSVGHATHCAKARARTLG